MRDWLRKMLGLPPATITPPEQVQHDYTDAEKLAVQKHVERLEKRRFGRVLDVDEAIASYRQAEALRATHVASTVRQTQRTLTRQ